MLASTRGLDRGIECEQVRLRCDGANLADERCNRLRRLVQTFDFLDVLLRRARDILDAFADLPDDVLVVCRNLCRVLALRKARLRDIRNPAGRSRNLLDTGRRFFDAARIRLALRADVLRERLDLGDDGAILVDAPDQLLRGKCHFLRDAEEIEIRRL